MILDNRSDFIFVEKIRNALKESESVVLGEYVFLTEWFEYKRVKDMLESNGMTVKRFSTGFLTFSIEVKNID